jgi:hypothetical protein
MTNETREALLAALEERRNLPPGTLFKDMVARGVIDEKGRVLLPSRAPLDMSRAFEPEPLEEGSKS